MQDFLLSDNTHDRILSKVITICGIEKFLPKLEHLQNLLSDEIKYLEEKTERIFVISGTNGKGETCHYLSNLLEKYQKKSAMWTSPHVLSLCERFIYRGNYISLERLEHLIDIYRDVALKNKLSFYEYLFYLFIKWSESLKVDCLILEVGLGGRYDAVNIFNHPISAIVSISRDHEEFLGNKLSSILKEKYGITRKKGVLYSSIKQKYLNNLLTSWSKRDGIQHYSNFIDDNLDYSTRNYLLAKKMTSDYLCFDLKEEKEVTSSSKGRNEKMTFLTQEFIFIGAHNLDGHRELLKYLMNEKIVFDTIFLSFSTGKEKQINDILNLYQSYQCINIKIFIFNHERAISKKTLLSIKDKKYKEIKVTTNWKDLCEERQVNGDNKKNILITGSYFFIAEVQKHICTHYSDFKF